MSPLNKEIVRAFLQDERGNIALLFGVMLTMLLSFAGAGIDYTRSFGIQTRIQEAADAGLLAAARLKATSPNATEEELKSAALRVFNAQTSGEKRANITAFSIDLDSATSEFTVSVDAELPTLLLRIAGRDSINVGVQSTATLGAGPDLEIALALDNTGSMGVNGKIQALREASTDLVTRVLDEASSEVKFSLVPFANYVNVGVANASATWIDAPIANFSGCVGSRSNPRNELDGEYNIERVPGLTTAQTTDPTDGQDGCPNAMVPLTDTLSTLTTAITNMNANGYTYIPAGLAWGWRALSEGAPFTQGAPQSDVDSGEVVKYLILLTDGENTRLPDLSGDGTHNFSNNFLANQTTEDLCTAVKDDDITVFTIAFDVSDTGTKNLLRDCASEPSGAFTPNNTEQLKRDFLSIANAVRSISLTR